ncbi:MAG: nucleotidyl transferase AbiEii/AbiGii toxin family protein [Myxococcota bacterium]
MKLHFLTLSTDERRLYFEQAAARRDVSPIVMEKDFWVCWVLSLIYASEFAEHLVFKGGTSLSKVYGVIERFSEDIDLSLSPGFLGLPEPRESRNQSNRWMSQAEEACAAAVRDRIAPVLGAAARDCLGERTPPWFEFKTDSLTGSPVLLFHYQSSQPEGFAYLARSVKLEFGSLTDQQPVGRYPIVPWVAEALPEAFGDWGCEVIALDVERTFWEKATILHAEHHRPADKRTPPRFSRHYADTAALAIDPRTLGAADRTELCARVVAWKGRFFGSSWANYPLARPGSFRLIPPPGRMDDLRADYRAMRDMYLTQPRTFDAVMADLQRLEHRLNG